LQGQIWRGGYQRGELHSEVYSDVPAALERWSRGSRPVAIYSSGSAEAQELLLRHTNAGDLTGYVTSYFDTTVGPKREADSYRKIARLLGLPAREVLFATDVVAEAEAAAAAGLQAVLTDRPGNPRQPPHEFPVVTEFTGI
jgi:enolase-phosphatase E1